MPKTGKTVDRRTLLKALPVCAACAVGGSFGILKLRSDRPATDPPALIRPGERPIDPLYDEGSHSEIVQHAADAILPEQFRKIKEFDRTYDDDFFIPEEQKPVLESASARVERAQQLVGHGNFNLLSFDQLLRFGENYTEIGAFTPAELELLESLFYADATEYGFLGNKVITDLTERIPDREVAKIAGSGHYLLKGDSLEKFTQIRRDVGDTITLTSGVRSIVKQYQLFLRKAVETEGNLSQASRSLAPPGYSFHARGDFDIGKVGFGLKNFTESFGETDEFRKLIDLGYISIRYTETNPFGVRHEPWHIKIA